MNNIVINGFGGASKNVPIGGYGVGTVLVPYITSPEGPISGGTNVYILDANSAAAVTAYSDQFDGVALDNTLWTDYSSGAGQIIADSGSASLYVGTDGGTARMSSVYQFKYINVEVSLNAFNLSINNNRIANYTYGAVSVVLDPATKLNSFDIRCEWSTAYGYLLSAYTVSGGVDTLVYRTVLQVPFRSVKLVRLGGVLRAVVDDAYIIKYAGWSDDAASLDISTTAPISTLAQSHVISIDNVKVSPLCTFGSNVAENSKLIEDRIQVRTPSYDRPGIVDVIAYSLSAKIECGQFTYTADTGLLLDRSGTLIIDNDSTIRGRL